MVCYRKVGSLFVALVGLAVTVPACGGTTTSGTTTSGTTTRGATTSDKNNIEAVIKITEANPKDWCTTKYVTSKFIASVGGEQKCLKTFVAGKNLRINSVTINGTTAVVKATDNSGPGTAYLIKQGGAWKIDSAKSG